ncbi:ribonuclease HII, partial [Helicobacter japonicus]
FVAGVIGKAHIIESFGAKDSKRLSPKRREYIYESMEKAQNKGEISIYVVEINAEEIDTNGLSFAMRKGIESLLKALGDYALQYKILQKELEINDTNNGDKRERFTIVIDGNTIFNAQIPQYLQELGLSVKTLVKADSLLSVVSCASIAAKVCKDRQMCALDKLYPQYKLAKNKGYGTLEHRKSIAQYGYCPHHRKSFAFNALKLL